MLNLPFNYCNLSLTEARQPYATKDGIVFDLLNILPVLKKKGEVNPLTGDKLTQADLTKLTFHRNEKQQLHCPIMFKVFSQNSHIVAVKETGNVYSYEAYKELNLDSKWFHDLLTEAAFDPAQLITLQDPKRPPRTFNYKQKSDSDFINATGQQKRTMQLVSSETALVERHRELGETLNKRQKTSASFTSTKLDPLMQR
jgi:hypothetical protein